MKVEIASSLNKRGVFVLTRDGDPWKEIHSSIFGKRPVVDVVSDEAFLQLEYRLAKAYVLRCLARRNLSSYELKKNLCERLVSFDNAEKIIQEMASLGIINDEDWISSFIRVQMDKKQGPKMIAMKLKSKGVADEKIEQALVAAEKSHPQPDRIRRLLETKYKHVDLNDYKEKRRVVSALLRKGFDYDEVRQALTQIATQT